MGKVQTSLRVQRLWLTSSVTAVPRNAAQTLRKTEGLRPCHTHLHTCPTFNVARLPTFNVACASGAHVVRVCVICSLVAHDLELTTVKDGILGTSRNIVLIKTPAVFGARDVEVFGEDGLSTPLPAPPIARAPSGRDMEYFDEMPFITGTRVGTIRLGARDVEVFGEDGLCIPLPAPLVTRAPSGRDMEYFDEMPFMGDAEVLDEDDLSEAFPAPPPAASHPGVSDRVFCVHPPPISFGARDAEVFGEDGLSKPLSAPQAARTPSGRDMEFFDEMPFVTGIRVDTIRPGISDRVIDAQPPPISYGARDVEVFGEDGLSAPLPAPLVARAPSGRDMEY